jgi:isoquinoline 1-oxidoreductase subunit beta
MRLAAVVTASASSSFPVAPVGSNLGRVGHRRELNPANRPKSLLSRGLQNCPWAFDERHNVTAMEHHRSAGWPTGVLAPARCRRHPMELRTINSSSMGPIIGPALVPSVSARCRTTLPTARFAPAGCARSDPAGPTRRTRPSWTRRRRRWVLQAAVLKRAAEKARWGSAMPKDTALGVATTFGQERAMPTWVALRRARAHRPLQRLCRRGKAHDRR